jgi:predicted transcriptional regulator
MHEDEDLEKPEPIEIKKMDKEEQIETADLLQAGLLQTYLRRLKNGTLSDTGLAALQRLLQANGWTLDPATMKKALKDNLLDNISPDEIEEQANILPLRKRA